MKRHRTENDWNKAEPLCNGEGLQQIDFQVSNSNVTMIIEGVDVVAADESQCVFIHY